MNSADGVEPVTTGKVHVEHAHIRLVLAGGFDRLIWIQGSSHDPLPFVRQSHTQRFKEQPVVVTDQQPHQSTRLDLDTGSTISATMPPTVPGLSSKPPPQAQTRARVMGSPSEL